MRVRLKELAEHYVISKHAHNWGLDFLKWSRLGTKQRLFVISLFLLFLSGLGAGGEGLEFFQGTAEFLSLLVVEEQLVNCGAKGGECTIFNLINPVLVLLKLLCKWKSINWAVAVIHNAEPVLKLIMLSSAKVSSPLDVFHFLVHFGKCVPLEDHLVLLGVRENVRVQFL